MIALLISLFLLGEGDTLVTILETTSPYQAMMYSSFVGVLVAAALSIGQRILSIHRQKDLQAYTFQVPLHHLPHHQRIIDDQYGIQDR